MMKRNIYIPYAVFLMIVLLAPMFVKNPYYLGVLVQVGIFSLVTMGLSLLMGYAGQISLGHAAFFGMGAYASAILTGTCHWSPWLAMGAGMLITACVAWFVGTPSLKLKGHYLAMATLGFGLIVNIFFLAEVDLTGGPSGYTFARIPHITFIKWTIKSETSSYYFVWGILLVILLLTLHIIHSRVGRALRSIHADEEAARAMGVNTAQYKVGIFILSGIYASLAGSLYAHYIRFVAPDPFGLMESVLLVTMVIVGGMGSIWGAIAGAALLIILPEALRFFQDYNILIYGAILLFIMLFLPGGIFGGSQMLWLLIRKIPGRRQEAKDG
ncbi:branched-chain amino acid ABC transporter permease [Candidatus Sumerlaeota bacterium]|nr:branched-chain amino acid ABC transporter permease [Candidatus Sumerlaeota bacterium]